MIRRATEITIRTLLRSANPLATDLLLLALESDEPSLRLGAARALARRQDFAGHRALVERFSSLPPEVRSTLSEARAGSPLTESLEAMLSPVTPRLARRAAEVTQQLGVVSLTPRLVEAVEWAGESSQVFARGALALAEVIAGAVHEYDPEVKGEGPLRPDPAFDRRATLNALGSAIKRYERYPHPELIEAFLLLTPPDESLLQDLLHSPNDAAYAGLLTALRTGHSHGVLGVLGAAMVDPRSPTELLSLAAERYGAHDLTEMFSRLGPRLGLRARENCRRIGTFAWLDPERIGTLAMLNDKAQAVAVQLAAFSAASRSRLVELIRLVLSVGGTRGRVAAARAIDLLPSHLAISPLREALACGDAAVLVVVIPMLQEKDFPDATAAVVPLLAHPDPRVRRAAGRSLSSLSFMAYRDQRHNLTTEERRRAGQLIDRADPMTRSILHAEIRSGVPVRRLEALELIEEMGLVDAFEEFLLRLTEDPDVGVRSEAVRLLGVMAPSQKVLGALVRASLDQTPAVSRAAQKSYSRLGGDVALAMHATAGEAV